MTDKSDYYKSEYPWRHDATSLAAVDISEDAEVCDVFVETGTNSGEGVEYAIKSGFKKIISIDIEKRFTEEAELRFSKEKYPNVDCNFVTGNSAELLNSLICEVDDRILFWLDGHGCGKNPLSEELKSIKNHKRNDHNILIDDVRMLGFKKGDDMYRLNVSGVEKLTAHDQAIVQAIMEESWGENTAKEKIIKSIMEINPDYNISYLGLGADIMYACTSK